MFCGKLQEAIKFMRILYIHGLDSSPNPERMGYLKNRGHQLWGLHLDYMNEPNSYQMLKDLVKQEKIEYLVGSSLGGFLGYYLGEEFGLACLLFNPAMFVSLEEANIQMEQSVQTPERWVVLGAEDDRVDPNGNWTFFQEKLNTALFQRVSLVQGLGHEIDLDTFACYARWAGL